jgi:carbon-monoxide dehydrogenase medium subunit
VKPVDFDYAAPKSVEEVLGLLATWKGEAKLLAGGQSLVPLLVTRAVRPRFVIDINLVRDLDLIRETEGSVALGATVRQADAEASELVFKRCPLLSAALRWVGSPQIRNRGTVIGSLAQRNAISQIPTVALALGARLKVLSSAGAERTVEMEDFLDAGHPLSLGAADFVTEAWFPFQATGTTYAFVETQRRQAHYATVGVAVTLSVNEAGEMNECRVAASGIAARVIRLRGVERNLQGQRPGPEIFREAAVRAQVDPMVEPLDDVHATSAYRRAVLPELIEQALTQATARPPISF